MRAIQVLVASAAATALAASAANAGDGGQRAFDVREYAVPAGSHPHDVAPARDGGVWYTEQAAAALGWLDPKTGAVAARAARRRIGSSRCDRRARRRAVDHRRRPERDRARRPADEARSPLPAPEWAEAANLNTAIFDEHGVLWFTGQSGVYGRLDPKRRDVCACSMLRAVRARTGSRRRRRRRVLRLARRQLPRSDRHRHRQGGRVAAADSRPGRAPGLVGLARPDLGQRVERRQARPVRADDGSLARVAATRAPRPSRTRSTSTRAMPSGSATSAPTRSCASTRAPSGSRQSRSRARRRRSANSSAGRARYGERSRASTSSSSFARAGRRRRQQQVHRRNRTSSRHS